MSSHTLQKVIWVQVAPQKLYLCHQSHICTNIKKNKSISYLLEETTNCTTNHKIAQNSAKFDTVILLSWIQFKNKVWYKEYVVQHVKSFNITSVANTKLILKLY